MKTYNYKESVSKINALLKRELKTIAASVLIALVLTAGITTRVYSDTLTRDISQKFIRFHVIANSDTEADQALKLKVRDGVLRAVSEDVENCENINEARLVLISSFEKIQTTAEKIMLEEGYNYTANISLENVMFPTRTYGDAVLSAGMYEALRIEIGEAKGKNWWCVVYPPLCYVDVAQGGALPESSKLKLKEDMTDEEYKFVFKEDFPVSVKFKLVEMWKDKKEDNDEKDRWLGAVSTFIR